MKRLAFFLFSFFIADLWPILYLLWRIGLVLLVYWPAISLVVVYLYYATSLLIVWSLSVYPLLFLCLFVAFCLPILWYFFAVYLLRPCHIDKVAAFEWPQNSHKPIKND